MKKILLSVLILALGVSLLAGCSEEAEESGIQLASDPIESYDTVSVFLPEDEESTEGASDSNEENKETQSEVAGFVIKEKKFRYGEQDIVLLNIENKTGKNYTLTVNGTYFDESGNVLRNETQSFEDFVAGYQGYFVFHPEMAFDTFSFTLSYNHFTGTPKLSNVKLLKWRMIQMGHVHAKGSLNYVDRNRIQPYSFDEASLRQDEHTFNIDRLTAGHLYEKNTDFRKVLDSGKFIYADGHIVRNEPRFVEQTPFGHMLTPWAVQRVDQCCLRFTRIYEQENVSKYIFGRMNYDPDYVKQTMFYLEDLINEKELDEIEAELQYKRNFPDTFLGAFDMLMKRNGDTRESIAEKLNTTSRTLYEWLKDPDRRINADFVVTIALLWRLPDWISTLLLDRAYIHFSETNRRHLALQYILKVLWSEGVDKANEFLSARKLDRLCI